MNDTDQVYTLFIRATPEAVWQALVDGSISAQYFFGSIFTSSLEPGAPFTYTFASGMVSVDGTIVEVAPQRSLVTTWAVHYDPSCAGEVSRVRWSLEARGANTKVSLVHELAGAPNTAKNVGNDGWSWVLSSMKTLLETGTALALPQRS